MISTTYDHTIAMLIKSGTPSSASRFDQQRKELLQQLAAITIPKMGYSLSCSIVQRKAHGCHFHVPVWQRVAQHMKAKNGSVFEADDV
jgi:hypothetical protein